MFDSVNLDSFFVSASVCICVRGFIVLSVRVYEFLFSATMLASLRVFIMVIEDRDYMMNMYLFFIAEPIFGLFNLCSNC